MKENLKKFIMAYSICIIPVMILTFKIISGHCGKTTGYFLPYAIYLTILLIGTIFFNEREENKDNFQVKHNKLLYIAAFIPVLATFVVEFFPTVPYFSLKLFVITLVYAVLNGTLEELFWRFTFNKVFESNIWMAYIFPTFIFVCWHFALLFAQNVIYDGGAIALIGGAAFMGILWGGTMYKTKNIKILIVAHTLVNFFAFSQLIYSNFLM